MHYIDQKIKSILHDYFDEELHSHLMDQMETVTLAGGEWLFKTGDEADAIFFLIRGRMRVFDQSSDTMLAELVSGDSVGEISMVSGEPRQAGVKAIRDCLLVRIEHDVFYELVQSHPSLVLKIASNISKKFQRQKRTAIASTMKTIGFLPLSFNPKVESFYLEFTEQLMKQSSAILVSPDQLTNLGAPTSNFDPQKPLPLELENWLSDLEDQYDYVIFSGYSKPDHWTQFIERQSDIVLVVADTHTQPETIDWSSVPAGCQGADDGRHVLILLHDDHSNIKNTRAWLDGRQYTFHLHIHSGLTSEIDRAIRIITGQGVGLVLGGGAARGLAALGVYKALTEAGISIDWVGGTSIGSIMAATIATGWSPEQAIANAHKAFKIGRPFNDITLPIVSLLGGKRMKRLLDMHLDYQIEDLPIPYFCVSTNLHSGTKNIHEQGSLVHAIRASAALPGVFPPVVVDNELAIDGAILDNLPVDVMREKHVGKVIAVEFSSTTSMKVQFQELPSPWAVILSQLFPFIKRYQVPKFMSIIMKATETGTLEQARLNALNADLLISPEIKQFGMTDVKSFDEIVQRGYDGAVEQLRDWHHS